MLRRTVIIIGALILICLLGSQSVGQTIADYLIVGDINGFIASKNPTSGEGPGMLAGADHFYLDHKDRTYRISYFNLTTKVGPVIQVTQHAGADSDRWLLHEVEDAYRRNPEQDYFKGTIREINGNKIFSYQLGTHYSWLSDNIVVDIKYTDLQKVKPEPLEVIQAYLQKIPSTITLIDTEAKSRSHNEQWIKDEMERRLWLCDKWFVRLESDRSKLPSILKTIADHMVVFLDYREKYYGISGKDDKLALMGYLSAKNEAGIKSKLTEYKIWRNVNKSKSINLP